MRYDNFLYGILADVAADRIPNHVPVNVPTPSEWMWDQGMRHMAIRILQSEGLIRYGHPSGKHELYTITDSGFAQLAEWSLTHECIVGPLPELAS